MFSTSAPMSQFECCNLADLFRPSNSKSKFVDVYKEADDGGYRMCGRFKFWMENNSSCFRYISKGGNIVPLLVTIWENRKIAFSNQSGGVLITLSMSKSGYVTGNYDLVDEGKVVLESKIFIKLPVK